MKEYVQNRSGPSKSILHCFCLTGGSTIIIAQVQWFVHQNLSEPSGGIDHLYKRTCYDFAGKLS